MHVSKLNYFCSLLINVIALKTSLRCISVITCYWLVVAELRMTKEDFSGFYRRFRPLNLVLTCTMYSMVDDVTAICMRN